MAYYLMVKKNNDYRSIDISDHCFFERISKYSGDKYSLEELDNFTSNYANELSLREALFVDGLLDENDVFRDISIRYKKGDNYIKVKYNPVFTDSKWYLDVNFLIYKIKSLLGNAVFLNKLLYYYRKSFINNSTVASIREFINGNPELNIEYLINEFVYREVYNLEYDVSNGTYHILSVKYKSLHDLAMFVYNFENKDDLSWNEICDELNLFIIFIKGTDKKILIKEKESKGLIDGQTSMFD